MNFEKPQQVESPLEEMEVPGEKEREKEREEKLKGEKAYQEAEEGHQADKTIETPEAEALKDLSKREIDEALKELDK